MNPFAPRGTVTREQLLDRARGRLSGEELRYVEGHIEADPLVREAAEGLEHPGALDLADQLDHFRPSAGRTMRYLSILSALLIMGAAAWSLLDVDTPQQQRKVGLQQRVNDAQPSWVPTERALTTVQIEKAVELPESLHIGHGHHERYSRTTAAGTGIVDRDTTLDRMEPLIAVHDPAGTKADRSTLRRERPSRQLVYLHDLKVVHPKELHPQTSTIELEMLHVDASHVDRTARDAARQPVRTMDYLPYMDAALAKFASNDHKGCLEDLQFLLGQYPDDVNALFYAGLCCYNVGLYTHARDLLHRSATHAVSSFDEESVWYHALTLERSGDREAAWEAFGKIAADSGFYADRAQARLNTRP